MSNSSEQFRTEVTTGLPIVPDEQLVIWPRAQFNLINPEQDSHFYRFATLYLRDETVGDEWDVNNEETPTTLGAALGLATRELGKFWEANRGEVTIVGHRWFLFDIESNTNDANRHSADFAQSEQASARTAGSMTIPDGFLLAAKVKVIHPHSGKTPHEVTDLHRQRYIKHLTPGEFKNYDIGSYDQSLTNEDGTHTLIDIEPRLRRHPG